jgi:hypothetical protein
MSHNPQGPLDPEEFILALLLGLLAVSVMMGYLVKNWLW